VTFFRWLLFGEIFKLYRFEVSKDAESEHFPFSHHISPLENLLDSDSMIYFRQRGRYEEDVTEWARKLLNIQRDL
jgi:hypothetical protein